MFFIKSALFSFTFALLLGCAPSIEPAKDSMDLPLNTANEPGPIDDRFDAIDDTQWSSFADSWLAELGSDSGSEYSDKVTYMKFMARPEYLWNFILLSTERAETDEQLGHIAAGLVERLLGQYGDQYIVQVERKAHADPKFARMLTGVRRYLMAEDVWHRVMTLQDGCSERLDTTVQHARVIELEKRHLAKLKKARRERQNAP